jgi:hypothetical protein
MTDLDLPPKAIAELASPDAVAAFFTKLDYDTSGGKLLSPEAVGYVSLGKSNLDHLLLPEGRGEGQIQSTLFSGERGRRTKRKKRDSPQN